MISEVSYCDMNWGTRARGGWREEGSKGRNVWFEIWDELGTSSGRLQGWVHVPT